MKKKELEAFRDLKQRIESWLERTNRHNQERKELKEEKKQLLKELNALEKKYEVQDV